MDKKFQTHNSLRLYRILIKSSTQVELVWRLFSTVNGRAWDKKKLAAKNVKSEINATVGWYSHRRVFFLFFILLKRINCISRISKEKKAVPQVK